MGGALSVQIPRLLITGSRTWTDEECIAYALEAYKAQFGEGVLISGHCPRGADEIAERLGLQLGYALKLYPADWNQYGKAAGFIRNQEMVRSKPTHCFAFIHNWSKGATHCKDLAVRAGIPTKEWRYYD